MCELSCVAVKSECIYIYGPYMYISHRNLGIERSSSIQVRGCHSFFATSSLRPPRVSLYVQFGSDRKLLRCQPWRVLSVVDWLISLRGGGRVTHVSASGSLKRGPPPPPPVVVVRIVLALSARRTLPLSNIHKKGLGEPFTRDLLLASCSGNEKGFARGWLTYELPHWM